MRIKYLRRVIDFIKIKDKRFLSAQHQNKIQLAEQYLENKFHIKGKEKTRQELEKRPFRFEVINFLLSQLNRKTNYLEIGLRDPDDNFNKINSENKFSVDPGLEADINHADFKMTSDEFFNQLENEKILNRQIRFDLIFIDGLHLAEQVERDIENALKYLKDDGFLVLHDCNPPTEFHASESYDYRLSPSGGYWNGTTWKAFFKLRRRNDIYSCCIDSDWGIGVASKSLNLGKPTGIKNDFYEFKIFEKYRKESLNLISFENLKDKFKF